MYIYIIYACMYTYGVNYMYMYVGAYMHMYIMR